MSHQAWTLVTEPESTPGGFGHGPFGHHAGGFGHGPTSQAWIPISVVAPAWSNLDAPAGSWVPIAAGLQAWDHVQEKFTGWGLEAWGTSPWGGQAGWVAEDQPL